MKLKILIFLSLLLSQMSFGQVYIDTWNMGLGFLYPRYVGADARPEDKSYGGFLSFQYDATEHTAFRLKGQYFELTGKDPATSIKMKSAAIMGGLDVLYTFVPCEPVSPYLGFGFSGFSTTIENSPNIKNQSYLGFQFNLIGGVYWNILGEGAKMKTEIGYHTVSENKFDGLSGPVGGMLGGSLDTYMSFELGFLFYFDTGSESKYCDIYSGIPRLDKLKLEVDYDKIEEIVKRHATQPTMVDYDRIEDIIKRYSEKKVDIYASNWVLVGVNFEVNSSRLMTEAYPILFNAVQVLLLNQDIEVEIQGHTDNTGSPEYNRKLSVERAETVRRFLVGKGINPQRLKVVGYGETRPISDNKTPQGRAMNRRIEFKVLNRQ